MPLRPMFQRDPMFRDVISGSSGPMQEFAPGVRFSDSARTPGDAQAIQNLSGTSYLRPLLQVRGEGGGPLSAADMENNAGAMASIDDYFTNAPMEQELRESDAAARLRRSQALAEDPLYAERAKAQMEFDQKDALAQLGDMRRQHVLGQYSDELSETQQRYQAAIDKAKAAGNEDLALRLGEELQAHQGALGARYGFMGDDQRNILMKGR